MADGAKLGQKVVTMPSDLTSGRPAVPTAGDMRFNSQISLMEYYDGSSWIPITTPPAVASISPTYFTASGETITLTGSYFSTSPTVTFISKTGTSYTAATTTYVNASTVTAVIPSGMNTDNNDPFDVKLTNSSGLAYTLAASLNRQSAITFTTASGSLATIYDSQRGSVNPASIVATNPEGDVTITYAVTSGSVPTGMTLNSNGTWSGTPSAVGADTTSTFTVTATGTDTSNPTAPTVTASRSFSITVKAPVITSYTATGAFTFSVPTGITSVQVLVVGAGGAGGFANNAFESGGGGGAGGLIYNASYAVTPGGSVPGSVGTGGPAPSMPTSYSPGNENTAAGNGSPSVFGTLTAYGGGHGGGQYFYGQPGGSGGGAGGNLGYTRYGSGTAGQGSNGGGNNMGGAGACGAGGGGAGGGGQDAPGSGPNGSGNGGVGLAYSITGSSIYYAGGGGGGNCQNSGSGTGAPGGNGGGGPGGGPAGYGTAGTTNRGGGGGGSNVPGAASGGSGGPGTVIVRY